MKECVKADGSLEQAMKIKGYFMDSKAFNTHTWSYETHLYYWMDENKYVRCGTVVPDDYELKQL